MSKKLKKFFLGLLARKKITGWLLLFFVVLGVSVPICYAYAWSKWDTVLLGICPLCAGVKAIVSVTAEGEVGFANAIITAAFSILITITSSFLVLSQSLLEWIISPGFINVPFTNNPIVNEGWGIVRDFTNMFIVLGFVLVALATILRIKEYEAQKLLPWLIFIALLINFTPVICGFIIDASNIAMNYFLTAGALDKSFVGTLTYQIDSMASMDKAVDALAIGIVFVIFNVVGAIIFLLFAFLFAVRYVALWILVILSPLAFFCFVFPAGKKIWSMWWNQFVQWCIIGIPAGFFIYLSNMLISEVVKKGGITGPPSGELTGFGTLFSYVVPLLFLVIGFFVTLQVGAMGASGIISGVSSGSKWAGAKVFQAAKGTKTGEKMEGWSRGQLEKYRLRPAGEYEAEKKKEREKAREQVKDMSNENLQTVLTRTPIGAGGRRERSAAYQELLAREKLKPGRPGQPGQAQQYLKDALGEANAEDVKKIKLLRPDLTGDIEEIQKGTPLSAAQKTDEIYEQIEGTDRLKFRQETEAEALKNKYVAMAMSKEQLEEIKTRGKVEQRKALQENIIANQTEMNQEMARLQRDAVDARGRGDIQAEQQYLNRRSRIGNNMDTVLNDPNFV